MLRRPHAGVPASARTLLRLAGVALTALTLSAPFPAVAGIPARLGLAPDNNGQLLLETLGQARRKIYVNIYEIESDAIVDALIERIDAGVTVEMLAEGQPLPQVSGVGRRQLRRIHDAMIESGNARNRLWIMTQRPDGPKRRYRYNHAKYVIADALHVLISSENFKDSGHPVGASPERAANRGWDVVLRSRTLASDLLAIFREDIRARAGDVVRYSPELLPPLPDRRQDRRQRDEADESGVVPAGAGTQTVPKRRHDRPIGEVEVDSARLVHSPAALDGLTELLRSSRISLEVQKMSLPLQWREAAQQGTRISPLVDEMLQAARRGVHVRVLLNDENSFPRPDPARRRGNELTLDWLADQADCDRLPLEIRVIDRAAANVSYIHNKGMIVDGVRTLVSSINGTQNSVVSNREMAVAIEGRDAARYYGDVFNADWVLSEHSPVQPVLSRRQQGLACRAQYVPGLPGVALLSAWL